MYIFILNNNEIGWNCVAGGEFMDDLNNRDITNSMECFDADFDMAQLDTGSFFAHITWIPFSVKMRNI